jgi:hypothetical protein
VTQSSSTRHAPRAFGAALCVPVMALLLSGCASRVERVAVDTGFPSPVVEPLPLRMGLHLPDELRNFRHEETIPSHSNWTFELGAANVSLFEPLVGAMFTDVVLTDSRTPGTGQAGTLHGVLEPHLERFEFDMPRGRDTRFAEVWLQYRVHLYSPDGQLLADWPVTGYGKSRASGTMPRGALKDAAVRAMRDAGANLSIRFGAEPAVADWLRDIDHGRAILGSVGESR